MRSPFRQATDLDDPVSYAPPWVREHVQTAPLETCAPADWPERSRSLADDDAFSGDRAVLEMQRQLALEPDSVPEPPRPLVDGKTTGRTALRACGASGAAALIAWALVSAPGARLLARVLEQGQDIALTVSPALAAILAPHQQNPASAPAPAARQPERADAGAGGEREAQVLGDHSQVAVPTVVAVAPAPAAERAPEVTSPAPPPIAQAAPQAQVIRQLDDDELKSLVTRGEQLIASGDLASARLVLRRAAEAGSARAALDLAGTFDPKLLPGQSLAADAAMARLWYERAKQFGSTEAPLRLQQLAAQVDTAH